MNKHVRKGLRWGVAWTFLVMFLAFLMCCIAPPCVLILFYPVIWLAVSIFDVAFIYGGGAGDGFIVIILAALYCYLPSFIIIAGYSYFSDKGKDGQSSQDNDD